MVLTALVKPTADKSEYLLFPPGSSCANRLKTFHVHELDIFARDIPRERWCVSQDMIDLRAIPIVQLSGSPRSPSSDTCDDSNHGAGTAIRDKARTLAGHRIGLPPRSAPAVENPDRRRPRVPDRASCVRIP
jgi:hypothetical protein